MKIVEASQAQEWDKFLESQSHSSLLQSWAWGNFQLSVGKKIKRLMVLEEEKLVGVSLLIIEKSRVGSFLYCPGGPVFEHWSENKVKFWLKEVENLAQVERVDFIRLEVRQEGRNVFFKEKFQEVNQPLQPHCTAFLDLTKSEADLLASSRDSTRYNIGWSKRKGVEIEVTEEVEKIRFFEKLLAETAARKHFSQQKRKDYYRVQFQSWTKFGVGKLLLAKFQGEVIAAAIITSYGDTTTYLHAASTTHVKLRQTYPLVWKAIEEGKKTGTHYFDFWGVSPLESTNHPWQGVSDFKLSFGSRRVCFEPCLDLVVTNKYYLHRLVEMARPWLKGFLR